MPETHPPQGDTVERLVAHFLRTVPETWTGHDPSTLSELQERAVYLLNAAGMIVKCHADCATSAIVAAMDLGLADLFPAKVDAPRPNRGEKAYPTANEAVTALERRHGRRSALWTYHGAAGNPVGLVVRWDKPGGKEIRPVARFADGWRVKAMLDRGENGCRSPGRSCTSPASTS